MINNTISHSATDVALVSNTQTITPQAGQLWRDAHVHHPKVFLVVSINEDRAVIQNTVTGKITNTSLRNFGRGKTGYFYAGDLNIINGWFDMQSIIPTHSDKDPSKVEVVATISKMDVVKIVYNIFQANKRGETPKFMALNER